MNLEKIEQKLEQLGQQLEVIQKAIEQPKKDDVLEGWMPELDARELLKRQRTWFYEHRKEFVTTTIGGEVYYSKESIKNYIEGRKRDR